MQLQPQRVTSGVIRGAGVLIAVLGLIPAETSARAPLQAAPFIHVPNLNGYWCVDGLVPDSGTTALDSSGNVNTGTYMSGATSIALAPPVPTGNTKSFSFTQASHQYITIPDSPSVSPTGAFTLSAWIFPSAASSVQQGILEKFDSSALNGFSFRLTAQNYYSFTVMNSSTSVGITTAGSSPGRAATIGAWNHIVAVYNPNSSPNMVLYRNGIQDASDSQTLGLDPVPPPTDGSDPLQIGKDYGGNAFSGQIDEARIYNRALTAVEADILRTGQPAATALVATGGPGETDLSWTAPANPGGVNLQYSVLRGTSSGVYDTIFNDIATTSFTDTTVTPGTAYYYAVVAVTVMSSAPSNESQATAGAGSPPGSASSTHGKAEMNPCGGGAAALPDGGTGALALAVILIVAALVLRR